MVMQTKQRLVTIKENTQMLDLYNEMSFVNKSIKMLIKCQKQSVK